MKPEEMKALKKKKQEELEKSKQTSTFGNEQDRLMRAQKLAAEKGAPMPVMERGLLNYQSSEQAQIEAKKAGVRTPMQITQEAELAKSQEEQQKETSSMIEGKQETTVAQRNVQAGMATVNSILQTFGGEAVSIAEQQARMDNAGLAAVPGKVILTALGKVTTVSIPFTEGFTLSELFSKSNAGNIAELTSDAASITGRARLIYADATSRGGDQSMAIEQLKLSEEAVRQRFIDASIALDASPEDIASGVDFSEEIYSSLVVLQSYRFALERQQLTGEKNEALISSTTTSNI